MKDQHKSNVSVIKVDNLKAVHKQTKEELDIFALVFKEMEDGEVFIKAVTLADLNDGNVFFEMGEYDTLNMNREFEIVKK
jgi:hypothetical protein